MGKRAIMGMLAVGVFFSVMAEAGMLRIGQPVLDGNQVTVPVVLEGNVADGVAALSFQLNYDPAALEPLQARPGAAAQSAGKDVMTNVPDPGTYMVVMAGLNSDTMNSGEVTHIVLERRGDYNSTNISITGTTFASLQGDEIPSRGSTGNILFREDDSEQTEESSDELEQEPRETDPAPEQTDTRDEIRPGEPVTVDPADLAASPHTQPTAQLPRDTGGPEGVQQPWPSGAPSTPEEREGITESRDRDRRLAEALTAAARSRSDIPARPAEDPDATQGEPPRPNAQRRLERITDQRMAAITESDAPTADNREQEGARPPRDPATVPLDAEPVPDPTAVAQPTDATPETPPEALPDTGGTDAQSSITSTLVFLIVVIGVVIGIVLLRRRLFA